VSDFDFNFGEGADAGVETYTNRRDAGWTQGGAAAAGLVAFVVVGLATAPSSTTTPSSAPPPAAQEQLRSPPPAVASNPPGGQPSEAAPGIICEQVLLNAKRSAARTRSEWQWWLSPAEKSACLGGQQWSPSATQEPLRRESVPSGCVRFNDRIICD
jgi:hypothetical protein